MFLFDRGDIADRLDPKFLKYTKRENLFRYPARRLGKLLLKGPEYGAGEPGIERTDVSQIRYIRITDINNFGLLQNGLGATAEFADPRYLLHDQDLLIARSGNTVGKSYLHRITEVPEQSIFAGYLIRFALDEEQALPEYVFTLTQLPLYKDWVEAIQRPSGQPNINAEEYRSWHLPVPPLEEQNEIVVRMRQAYEAFSIQEKAAQSLLASVDNYLLSELGIELPPNEIADKVAFTHWHSLRGNRWDAFYHHAYFDAIASTVSAGRYKAEPLKAAMLGSYVKGFLPGDIERDGPYKIVQINTIGMDGRLDLSDLLTLSQPLLPHQILRANDILVVLTGATIGKIGFWEMNEPDFFLGGDLLKFQVNKQYDPDFVYAYLRTSPVQQEIKRNITGATNGHLSPYAVERLLLPSPPLAIQQRLGDYARTTTAKAFAMQAQAAADFTAAKAKIESLILA